MHDRGGDVRAGVDAQDGRRGGLEGGVAGVEQSRRVRQARSISHWSPYDRVGAVNAVP